MTLRRILLALVAALTLWAAFKTHAEHRRLEAEALEDLGIGATP